MSETTIAISALELDASPPASGEIPFTDPTDDTTGSTGTTKKTTIGDIVAMVPEASTSARGTIQLSGNDAQYLNGAGNWSTPTSTGTGGGSSSGGAPTLQIVWIDALVPTGYQGSTDILATIKEQVSAASGNPLLIMTGEGSYLFNDGTGAGVTLGENQSMGGVGSAVTEWNCAQAGPLVKYTAATFNDAANAGALFGASVAGPYGSSGTLFLEYEALQHGVVDDIGVYGCDGGIAWGKSAGLSDWSEEWIFTRGDWSENGATSGWTFRQDGTSMDYSKYQGIWVGESDIDVAAFTAGGQGQGDVWELQGNLHGGTSTNTGAIFSIERQAIDASNSGASNNGYLVNFVSMVTMEASGNTSNNNGHYLVWMESTNYASQFSGHGVLSISAANAVSQGVHNPNFLPCLFHGLVNNTDGTQDNSTNNTWGPVSEQINGGLNNTLTADTVYWDYGNTCMCQLASGAQTLVFSGLGSASRRLRLILQGPASGTATFTLPTGWSFGSASAPSVAATDLCWLELQWLGTVVDKGLAATMGNGYPS